MHPLEQYLSATIRSQKEVYLAHRHHTYGAKEFVQRLSRERLKNTGQKRREHAGDN